MSYRVPKLITAPAEEPVSREWLKSHLHFDIADDNTLIDGYIKASREYFEKKTNMGFITQTVEESINCWWSECYELRLWPVQSLSQVTYVKDGESSGTDITTLFDIDTYNDPGVIRLKEDQDYPSDLKWGLNTIKIRYVVGYGDDETNVPEAIRQAIRLRASTYFIMREDGTFDWMTSLADNLIKPFQRFVS